MHYLSQVTCEHENEEDGFKAILRIGEETYIGIGSSKKSAKDQAAEKALEIWSVKSTPEKKSQEKTPVTTLNEYCQKYKVRMFSRINLSKSIWEICRSWKTTKTQ